MSWHTLYHHGMGHYMCRGTSGGTRHMSCLGVWHHGIEVVARIMAWVTCRSTTSSTMSRVIVVVVAREVTRVTCLGSAHGHQARPRGTGRVSWVGSRALCKAPWHTSWHRRWHASHVLAQLVGTKQGPVACVLCLGSARGHHARPRGTRHGTSSGMHPASWLG